MISPEQKQRAVKLYRNKSVTISEISNLTDISIPQLSVIFRQAFELGILNPRNEQRAMKPRVPNGKGKSKYVPTGIGKGGRSHERKKFTEEQEKEIATDYYLHNLSFSKLKDKWGIHPMQLQYIRETYGKDYPNKKQSPIKKAVLQYDTNGNLISEFESGFQASKQTNVNYININQCCNGKMAKAGGFIWKFK